VVLPRDFPVELLGAFGGRFALGVTLGSSSIYNLDFVDETVSLFDNESGSPEAVSAFIREYIRGYKLTFFQKLMLRVERVVFFYR
jgi:hypothetical protein